MQEDYVRFTKYTDW